MKKLYTIIAWCVLGIAGWQSLAYAWDYPLYVYPEGIKFNHNTSSSSSDALTIRKNNGATIVTAPEYYLGARDSVAYRADVSDPSVKVFFSCFGEDECDFTLTAYCSTGNFFDLGEVRVYFNGSYVSDYETFTSSGGSVPSTVGWRTFLWEWSVTQVSGQTLGSPIDVATTRHGFYTILTEPSSFYCSSFGETGVPWTDVLDWGCNWASGETSYSACMSKLTQGLYGYSGLKYTPDDSEYSAGDVLYLQELLDEIDSQSSTMVNCVVYANLLDVLAYSIGITSSAVGFIQISRKSEEDIVTKKTFPAGWTSPREEPFYWGLHQIVYFYNESQWDNCIADAAAQVYDGTTPVLAKGDVTYNYYIPKLTDNIEIVKYPSSGRGHTQIWIVP